MHVRRILPAVLVASVALAALSASSFAAQSHDYTMLASNSDSPIIVTESSSDEAITRNVVDVLSNDSRLAGKIGVQTIDGEVELSGIVTGAGMMWQAERDAKSVHGVRNVRNLMSTRMGGGRY